jgi:maltooligosyltrehalose synthase
VVAYARQFEDRWALVVVPRFVRKLSQSARPPLGKRLWKETRLQLSDDVPGHWRNIFTSEELTASTQHDVERVLYVHEIFHRLPVALLG